MSKPIACAPSADSLSISSASTRRFQGKRPKRAIDASSIAATTTLPSTKSSRTTRSDDRATQ